MDNTDVAIVGGGLAGLTAACLLARAGYRVDVYEKNNIPGGYISSFEREGYRFPAGPACFGSNGIVFPILEELGLEPRALFLPTGNQISWDKVDIPLENPGQTRKAFEQVFPGESKGLRKYFRWIQWGGNAFSRAMDSGMMFGRKVIRTIVRTAVRHPMSICAFRVAESGTNRSIHARYFRDLALRRMLDQLGFPIMSGRNTLGMWVTYYKDLWVPSGGMQTLSDRLADTLVEKGGRIHYGQPVRRITTVDGLATGIVLEGGKWASARWIISAADVSHTCLELLSEAGLPMATLDKLRRGKPSESIFAMYLGLRGAPDLDKKLERFHKSHVAFTCKDGKEIQLALLSKDDPSAAPPGKHALFAGMLSPYEEWSGCGGDPSHYREIKELHARELLERTEEFIPGLGRDIEVLETASPLTFERATRNWQGGTSGWSWEPGAAPRFDFAADIPIRNLYLAGHGVFQPGGVPAAMISAWYIAREIIRQGGGNTRN